MKSDAKDRLIERMAGLDEAVWVFCGDSITEGIFHTRGRRNYVQLVESRVRYLDEKGWTMHLFVNSAISGNSTNQLRDTLEHRALRFRPDIFSLMIGMNDCCRMTPEEFGENLMAIVAEVRQSCGADVLLQTCNSIHPELHPERDTFPRFMAVVREVAGDLDTALIDHHAAWEQVRREDRDRFDAWMADRGHPNAVGHWVLAERILQELELGPLAETPPPDPSRVGGGE